MRKLLLILGFGLVLGGSAYGQSFTISPSQPQADQDITVTIDVTGYAPLDGVEPLYIWIFKNGCCGSATNGSWENSNEAQRMTKVRNNVWEFTFKPTVILERTVGQLGTSIGFLVKAKDGRGSPEKKTADQTITLREPPYEKRPVEIFPRQFSANDLVTITFDFNLFKEENPDHALTVANPSELWFFSQTEIKNVNGNIGGWTENGGPSWCDVGASQMKLTPVGDGVYVIRMIPNRFFNIPAGSNAASVKVNIRNQNAWCDGQQEGQTVGDIVWNTLER